MRTCLPAAVSFPICVASYSPECVEGWFSELRAEDQITRLGDTPLPTRPVGCPRSGPLSVSPFGGPGPVGPGRGSVL